MPHVPASPESRPSSPRPFDFADLGKPTAVKAAPPAPAPAVVAAPAVPVAAASGDLDELGADDILESDDIEPLEAAAAGFAGFGAPPPADPSGFEIAEIDTFEEVEVEGHAARNAAAAVGAVQVAEAVEVAPASMKVDYAAPLPSTLVGMPSVAPPAPVTSPITLESMITDDAFPEKTLELRSNDVAKATATAAALDASEPQHTEVLKRSDMPGALHAQTLLGGMQAAPTPAPPAVHTPATAFAVQQARSAPAWQNGQPHAAHAGSIAPVAVDVAGLPRPTMPSIAAHAVPVHAARAAHAGRPAKKGLGGLAIGGLVFAAVALVGLVGVGGFAASRALSGRGEPVASSTTTSAATEGTAAAAAAPAAAPAPSIVAAAAASEPASPATLDVSALPSAPAPGAAPRGFTGSGSFTPPSSPAAAPAPVPVAVAPTAGTVAVVTAAPAAPAPRGNGGSALAAPGQASTASGIKTTALPPPGAAPAIPAAAGSTPLPPPAPPVAAAAPAAAQSSTGIVRVDPNLRAVVVDGSYRRATDGVLTVSCGSHRIKAGMKEQQTVNVPCGGSVSL